MAKEAIPAMAIGIGADGQLPLPWLGAALVASAALDGAHAVLIHGPAGAGQLELALLIAQAGLCEGPGEGLCESPGGGPGEGRVSARQARPCGRCASCHLVATRVHPDLLLVLPDALRLRLGWVDDDDSKLLKADAKPSREIRVEQVRQAIDWSQQTSGRGRGKLLVLHPADALNGVAANALLKTLEEPPGRMRLLLTSADPERLLPTVRSRCQRLPLALPGTAAALAWLRGQGLDNADALLAATGGSPLDALAWAQDGIAPTLLAALPRRVAAGDASVLAGQPVPRVVELLLKLAHDAQVLAAGGQPRFFAASQCPVGADLQALQAWQQALLRVARHAQHPWSAGLLVESLVTQAAAVWAGAGRQGAAPGVAPQGVALKVASLHSAR